MNSKFQCPNKNFPIGIFDSGFGGLTVFSILKKTLPEESFIYFGDSINAPVGEKSKAEIIRLALNAASFLVNSQVKAIVVACHTFSSNALHLLNQDLKSLDLGTIPYEENNPLSTEDLTDDNFVDSERIESNILGKIPIFGISESALSILEESQYKNVALLATTATIKSNYYQKAKNPTLNLIPIACPKWVPFIESCNLEDIKLKESFLEYLGGLKNNIPDAILLGCTHYPFLIPQISNFFKGQTTFIDPAEHLANRVKNYLIEHHLLATSKKPQTKMISSGNPKYFKKTAQTLLDLLKY